MIVRIYFENNEAEMIAGMEADRGEGYHDAQRNFENDLTTYLHDNWGGLNIDLDFASSDHYDELIDAFNKVVE